MFLVLGFISALVGMILGLLWAVGAINDRDGDKWMMHACIACAVFGAIHFLFNGA